MLILSFSSLLIFLLIYHGYSAQRCNHTLTEPSGTIASTNAEAYNYDGKKCQWNIQMDQGRIISLIFDWIRLPCRDGKIEILSTENRTEMCGHDNPEPIISNGNAILIGFIPSTNHTYYGFNASYYSTTTGCDGNLNKPSGAFASPGYPYYGYYKHCHWKITVDQDRRITLRFITFEVIWSTSCGDDKVVVYDGENVQSSQLGTFCGTRIPALLKSTGNSVTIHFKRIIKEKTTYRGFLAVYKSTGPADDLALELTSRLDNLDVQKCADSAEPLPTASSASEKPQESQIAVLGVFLAIALLTILGLLGYIALLWHKKTEDSIEMMDRNPAPTSASTETNAPISNRLAETVEMEIEDNVNHNSFEASGGFPRQQVATFSVLAKVGPITGDIYSGVHKVQAAAENIYANT